MTSLPSLPIAQHRLASSLFLAVALACGCDANHVLGVADAGAPGTGSAGAGGNTSPANGGSSGGQAGHTTTPVVDASTGPEVGPLGPSQTWTGYVENFMFPSGSDVLTITVAADSQGNAVGTITIGKGTPPAPATDPNVGYPPSYDKSQPAPGLVGPDGFYLEGYPYTFNDGVLTSQRLHFTANLDQLWAGWCALQTEADGSGSCVPNSGGMFSGDGTSCAYGDPAHPGKYIPIDCGKLSLCGPGGPCLCTASGCALNTIAGPGEIFSLDIAINGGTANGSIEGPVPTENVQFTKGP
jgi:hypothetical protein